MAEGRLAWSSSQRTSAQRGAASWRTSSPTSAPGCASSEPVTLHESTAIVAVPNDFTRTQLEGRLRGQLEDALTVALGREIRIAVTVNPALEEEAAEEAADPSRRVDRSTRRHVDKPT